MMCIGLPIYKALFKWLCKQKYTNYTWNIYM